MDEAQFTDLIRRHAGLIQKVAFAFGRGVAEREDVAQEIAVQLWRSRARFDPRFKESTWIYRVALNVAISFQRRERRHRDGRETLETQWLSMADVPEPSAPVQQLLECIERLDGLSKALVLLHLEGSEHAVIADVLGISVSNVGTKLARIKGRLRSALEQRAKQQRKESNAVE